jgi:hypothetical protein
MVTLQQFIKVFKDSGIGYADLRVFYHSVRKSIILLHLRKHSWSELFEMEEKSQWPILQVIDDPQLPLYRGADESLLNAFLDTIAREKKLRANKRHMEKVKYWSGLQDLIEERSRLFISIFAYSKKDIRRTEAVAGRYRELSDRRMKKQLTAVGIGAGAAAAAAGAAALWLISKKDKK